MAKTEKAAGVERLTIVLFYDPVSGTIVHGHYASADPGSKLPGRAALERQAIEHAKRYAATRKGVAVEKLPRLHVDQRSFRMDRPYRVDVRKRSLVPLGRRKS